MRVGWAGIVAALALGGCESSFTLSGTVTIAPAVMSGFSTESPGLHKVVYRATLAAMVSATPGARGRVGSL